MKLCNQITDKGAVVNLSGSCKAEPGLEGAEDRFRSLLEVTDDGYCEIDLACYLTSFNDQFCRLLETDGGNLAGTSLLEFMAESGAGAFYDALNSACSTGKPSKVVDLALTSRTGNKRSFDLLAGPVTDNSDERIGFWCLWRDTTAIKTLEDQICQTGKMEAIGHLVGRVAHDFNNLLTAMLGFSDILALQIPEDAPYRDKAIQIGVAARRAADLTRQLLVFSRRRAPDVGELDLNVIILEIESILRRLIGEDIELVTFLGPSLEKIRADRCQIEQILLNLVINARDAMPTGGKVVIATSMTKMFVGHDQQNDSEKTNRYVMLTVTDDGDGIDPASLPRIFDPFFTTKEKGCSAGVGLATVDAIVRQYSGHIRVASEPRAGTTFTIYLPSAGAVRAEIPADASTHLRVGGTETVLVVEDEQIVLDWAIEALRMLGYTILSARDPGEAIRIAHRYAGPIHLLLTDVVLPRMDGPTLAKRLSRVRPGMKAVYMSGYTGNRVDRYEFAQGGPYFLGKPFTVESLSQKIREVLDEPAAEEMVSAGFNAHDSRAEGGWPSVQADA
jgi:two-component system, cell cycle sensor histidine kinase and response regulator CckA